MHIFIAWSGDASHRLAESLFKWLPDVIPAAEPFMSSESIRKGQRWFSEISAQLEKANFAVLCVTPENLDSLWMHFEAGAVSKSTTQALVSALLVDVTTSDLQLPLSQFHHTPATKDEVLKLVLTINSAPGAPQREEDRVRKAFDKFWPDLEAGISRARETLRAKPATAPAQRRSEDILEDILNAQQGIAARLANLESQLTYSGGALGGLAAAINANNSALFGLGGGVAGSISSFAPTSGGLLGGPGISSAAEAARLSDILKIGKQSAAANAAETAKKLSAALTQPPGGSSTKK